nr:basic helix-loop-helix transcription factor [Loropetalum chinense var. rubrum]
MALEAVVFQQDLFNYNNGKDLYSLFGGNWSYDPFGLEREEDKACFEILENQTEKGHYGNWTSSPPSSIVPHLNEWCHGSNNSLSSEADIGSGSINNHAGELISHLGSSSTSTIVRPKRRRSKSRKNKEEIEYQRMTHIAVERNRRKQMNDYLSVLRSLMPDSYGDQASIIGGAINFVKELEQRLHSLCGQKQVKRRPSDSSSSSPSSSFPFSEFFTFPQYSTSSTHCDNSVTMSEPIVANNNNNQVTIADIEVTMVESHANLKIRSRRRPKQLLKMVNGLQILRLTILHLNVTTVDQIVEDDCNLTSVDEIATAVYEMLGRIQEEACLN